MSFRIFKFIQKFPLHALTGKHRANEIHLFIDLGLKVLIV